VASILTGIGVGVVIASLISRGNGYSPFWIYFGLVGSGMYLYFAGRGIAVRLMMQRRGIRIGQPETLKVIYVFLTLWGLTAVITIIMTVAALPPWANPQLASDTNFIQVEDGLASPTLHRIQGDK
jgi:4-amino-4-deoxy-L-arabinose transferase-like glycosyltransferase